MGDYLNTMFWILILLLIGVFSYCGAACEQEKTTKCGIWQDKYKECKQNNLCNDEFYNSRPYSCELPKV